MTTNNYMKWQLKKYSSYFIERFLVKVLIIYYKNEVLQFNKNCSIITECHNVKSDLLYLG